MRALQEQLTKYLTDAHSIERQALAQMRVAPKLAGDPQIADAFVAHCHETERHERLVRERLEERAARPSKVKDALGILTGMGFVAFARVQPDTTGKLVAHAFSYEHMERAAYEMIGLVAERAGDEQSVAMAREIGAEEDAMAARLRGCFEVAVNASLHEAGGADLDAKLARYLADAHAIEGQGLRLLDRARKLAGDPVLADAYARHRAETESHAEQIERRLEAHGAGASRIKDAALQLGALNWGAFFQAQPDTPAKLAAFAFAFEHLEVAAYSLLAGVAGRAGDEETERVATRIGAEEAAAAERLHSLFEVALDASLPPRRGAPAVA